MKFTKMHGIGNDYIYFNCLEKEIENPEQLSIKLSDRHFGVGGDGIVLILPSDKADFRMRMFNADGSEGKMCGNGIRCVAKYVYENMQQNGYRLGGEQSGHIIFSKLATTGDGILTSLKVMEVMLEKKAKLSDLARPVVIYPQLLVNVRVHDKPAAQGDADVQAAVKAVEEALGNTGRILVRESGTEPVIRVMVEAETEEICSKYV